MSIVRPQPFNMWELTGGSSSFMFEFIRITLRRTRCERHDFSCLTLMGYLPPKKFKKISFRNLALSHTGQMVRSTNSKNLIPSPSSLFVGFHDLQILPVRCFYPYTMGFRVTQGIVNCTCLIFLVKIFSSEDLST